MLSHQAMIDLIVVALILPTASILPIVILIYRDVHKVRKRMSKLENEIRCPLQRKLNS